MPHNQKDVLKIKIMENLLGIRIIPVWTPRSHARIMLADEGSNFCPHGGWTGIFSKVYATLSNLLLLWTLLPQKKAIIFLKKIPKFHKWVLPAQIFNLYLLLNLI